MKRVPTTVVALVGEQAPEAARDLGSATNVRAVTPDAAQGPLERAVAAWREAVSAHTTYLVHDADPLAAVADAWIAFYGRTGVRGDLEVAIAETLARWRADAIELPDYYLVLDPDTMDETRRHWFLGHLRDHAPHRVAPVTATPSALRRELGRLRAGRWWPELDRLLDDVERRVPDEVRLPQEEDEEEPAEHLIR